MMSKRFVIHAAFIGVLATPIAARAQELASTIGAPLMAQAFNDVVAVSAPAPNNVNPAPEHTGWGSLVKNTWGDFKAFPRRKSTWVILGIGAGAALAAHPADKTVNAHLEGKEGLSEFWAPGKFIGATYTQVGVSVGLYLVGRYVVPPVANTDNTNKWSHMGFDLLRAQALSQALVQGMKFAVRRDRPTGVCCSFPSGHAAAAWAAASVIERHFGYRMALPTMVIASYVATSRLHENVHYLSDVLMGSAVGIASGWTVVGRHGRSSFAITPAPVRGGFALQIARVNR